MTVSCQFVLQCLREFCPPKLALEGDPTGLQLGSADKQVERVLCTLDLTLDVAREAVSRGAGLIVSHHAVIYRPLRDLRTDLPRGQLLETLIKGDVAVYVPHTALDVTQGGLNDALADVVGLATREPLEITRRLPDEIHGIGRIGRLATPETVAELADRVKVALGAPAVRLACPDPQRQVKKVAVSCGDGRSFVSAAVFAGAEAMVTGDIDHHTALDARARGIALIDVGHWASERAAGELLAEALRSRLAGRAVEVVASEVETQPFEYR